MKASAESAEASMSIMTSCPESAEAFMLIMTACRNFRQPFTNIRQAAGTSGKLSGSWGVPIYGEGSTGKVIVVFFLTYCLTALPIVAE